MREAKSIGSPGFSFEELCRRGGFDGPSQKAKLEVQCREEPEFPSRTESGSGVDPSGGLGSVEARVCPCGVCGVWTQDLRRAWKVAGVEELLPEPVAACHCR